MSSVWVPSISFHAMKLVPIFSVPTLYKSTQLLSFHTTRCQNAPKKPRKKPPKEMPNLVYGLPPAPWHSMTDGMDIPQAIKLYNNTVVEPLPIYNDEKYKALRDSENYYSSVDVLDPEFKKEFQHVSQSKINHDSTQNGDKQMVTSYIGDLNFPFDNKMQLEFVEQINKRATNKSPKLPSLNESKFSQKIVHKHRREFANQSLLCGSNPNFRADRIPAKLSIVWSFTQGFNWIIKNRDSNDDMLLEKKFFFVDFEKAAAFMVKVAIESSRLNHHPRMYLFYNSVRIRLGTYVDKKRQSMISEADIALASIIQDLYVTYFEPENHVARLNDQKPEYTLKDAKADLQKAFRILIPDVK
ncbi:hypothetical protein V1514DRAFT_337922 [Lipomyces japonicus]|uniref:uncharacterized protein n=1 Tax=Lipomyces japonicus TaxID=56871 RepID=UPI0034CD1788